MIRVVMADDHAVVRDGLRLILESQNDIEVVGEAADGREVLDQVQALHPDVVIMDIAMPQLDGIEATERIRRRHSTTQVVILSMHSTSEYVHRAFQAGAGGYLLKESAGGEVIEAVRSVHSGHNYLSEKITDIVINECLPQAGDNCQKSPIESLSSREREVMQLVVEGRTSAEIATTLCLSQKTVETYRSRLMHKLGVKTASELIRFASDHNMISPQ
ncbi:response regulator [Candidatus Hydrogenedentota bacterium]